MARCVIRWLWALAVLLVVGGASCVGLLALYSVTSSPAGATGTETCNVAYSDAGPTGMSDYYGHIWVVCGPVSGSGGMEVDAGDGGSSSDASVSTVGDDIEAELNLQSSDESVCEVGGTIFAPGGNVSSDDITCTYDQSGYPGSPDSTTTTTTTEPPTTTTTTAPTTTTTTTGGGGGSSGTSGFPVGLAAIGFGTMAAGFILGAVLGLVQRIWRPGSS